MTNRFTSNAFLRRGSLVCAVAGLFVSGCASVQQPTTDIPGPAQLPPGVDTESGIGVSGMIVGQRLMEAGEYDAAIDAFNRAAVEEGVTPQIMVALGSANLELGRLGASEELFRRAITMDDETPAAWNNLGVVMMEQNDPSRALQMFRRAYALDNGETDMIRDNLLMAEAKVFQLVPEDLDSTETTAVQVADGGIVTLNTQKKFDPLKADWTLAAVDTARPDSPIMPQPDSAPGLILSTIDGLSTPVIASASSADVAASDTDSADGDQTD